MIDILGLSAIELAILAASAAGIICVFEIWLRLYGIHVKNKSVRFKALCQLNERYDFYDISAEYTFYRRVKTKAQLDRFNFDRALDECIGNDIYFFELYVTKVRRNISLFENYEVELESLPEIDSFRGGFLLKYIRKRTEDKVFHEKLLHPVIDPEFTLNVRYESPKGERLYSSAKIYSFCEFEEHYESVRRIIESRSGAPYQRKKMTDSLRYDILKRDNFHCVLCGRGTEDGVKLHVDHIVPISKGGITARENLRTLCGECNLGKSDKYDSSGIN